MANTWKDRPNCVFAASIARKLFPMQEQVSDKQQLQVVCKKITIRTSF